MGFNRAFAQILQDSSAPTRNYAYGIDRKWYPKWAGWDLIERNDRGSKQLQDACKAFYYTYYWQKLQLDGVQDDLADIIFFFATKVGKKVIMKKVQRILQGRPLAEVGKDAELVYYHLLLELFEFFMQAGSTGNLQDVLHKYYDYQHTLGYGGLDEKYI